MDNVTIGKGKLAGKGVYAARDFDAVAPLVADDAEFWFTNGSFSGKPAIKKAFEDTYQKIKNETYSISDVKWIITTYWFSVCTYMFKSEGIVAGKKQIYKGRGTNVLKRIDGSWRIVHEHLSKLPE